MFAQREHYGFLGSRDDGGFAEFVRVPMNNVVRVPDSVDDDAAALLEPICVALHAVRNSGLSWGDNVAVFGLGAIGNFIAQWARAFGAKHVFAVDTVPEKVEIARAVGLTDALCAASDVEDSIARGTGGSGIDVAFEASGSSRALAQAVSLLRPCGRLGLVGRPADGMALSGSTFEKILRAQLVFRGTWSFEFTAFPHNAWAQGVEALESGQISTASLVTHRLPLARTGEAVRMMAEKKEFIHKILVEPWQEC